MKKLFSLALMLVLLVGSVCAQFNQDTTKYDVEYIVKKSKGKYSVTQNIIDENGSEITIKPVAKDSVEMDRFLKFEIAQKQSGIDSLSKKIIEIEDQKAFIRKYMDQLINDQKRYRQFLWVDEKALKKLKAITL